jgi:NAD(P)-dependent dehydrogenase (short-subunit alcohol dehydrogenase family)
VRFGGGMETLVRKYPDGAIFAEIGPGRDLSALASRHTRENPGLKTINFLRTAGETAADDFYFLNKLGYMWLYGKRIDWNSLHEGRERRRIPLPTYPFERRSFRAAGNLADLAASARPPDEQIVKKTDRADRFYLPGWKPALAPLPSHRKETGKPPARWLVLEDRGKLAEALIDLLKQQGCDVVSLKPGDGGQAEDYQALFEKLQTAGRLPGRILHLRNVTPRGDSTQETALDTIENRLNDGFYSLLHIAAAVGSLGVSEPMQLIVVSTGMQEVMTEGLPCPGKAPLLGALKTIPQEHPFIRCRSIDLEPLEPGATTSLERAARQLLAELTAAPGTASFEPEVAFRGGKRWVRHFQPVRLEEIDDRGENGKSPLPFREKGVYMITGGLGGMGLALAEYLARQRHARLVLVGRTPLPPRDQWPGCGDARVEKILRLETLGAEVMTAAADVSQLASMRQVVEQAETRFGPISGVIHAAGLLRGPSFQAAASLSREACQEQFQAKIHGLLALEELFHDKTLDFRMIASSIASVLGGVAFAAYAAGNLFMDAYARCLDHKNTAANQVPWTVVNWDSWLFDEEKIQQGIAPGQLVMTPEEGVDAFCRILAHRDIRQVVHSLGDLDARIHRWIKLEFPREATGGPAGDAGNRALQPRPDLMNAYVAPRDHVEAALAEIWRNLFGFEKIGVRDNFFELGGDSLKVLNVTASIHKRLNAAIPVPDFFDRPFIEGIGRLVKQRETSDYNVIPPAPRQEYYALSPAQKRLYIIQQMEKQSTGYNEAIVLLLEGRFSREKLDGAFQRLIRRHESFRTSFHVHGDQTVQKIHPAEEVKFEVEYYETGEEEIDGVLTKFSRAFALEQPPLLRAAVLEVAENRHILAVEMHHIISDGRSYQIFIREFALFYEGGAEPPELTLQYKDFAHWMNGKEQRAVMEKQEDYWLQRFAGAIPRLTLPCDYPRPEIKRFEGASLEYHLPAGETAALKELASQEEATFFMVLLTLFNIWMFKLSRQEDIVVGTPVFGRGREELQSIVGMFVNTLALRNFPAPGKTFTQFLKEVRESTLSAFANQDYPFEELADRRAGQRDAGRNPLFDVLFTLQNVEKQPLDLPGINLPGLRISPRRHDLQQAQFDLLMFAHEAGDVLGFKLVYCTALFKRETVERLAGYFREIVSDVLQNKDVLLGDIKISHRLAAAELDIAGVEFDF